MTNFLNVPAGRFAVSTDDDAARRKREEIARKLRAGEDVNVTNTGEIVTPSDPQATNETLVVPPGKLAASFNRQERQPRARLAVVRKHFSQSQRPTALRRKRTGQMNRRR
ncbi:MAG: hypothetical protein FWB78_08095 [Treponema sp.]|nr:hypothetical protein [Treponema sp.]